MSGEGGRRRIVGVEVEYGITHVSAAQALSAEEAAQELFADPSLAKGANMFLPNGGRLYLDVGAHPEYATAECALLGDVLVQDRFGSELLGELAHRATQRLNARGVAGAIHLLRNNLDSAGSSFGCHENYLIRRRFDFRARVMGLVPHLVSRQVVAGAGHVCCGEDGSATYVLSQRADVVSEVVSAATTRARPLINTRDEPHANHELYRRLHIINADTSMAEGSNLINLASTALVLSALEEGARLTDLELVDPIGAVRAISAAPQARVELKNGQWLTGLELQAHYVERTAALAAADPDPWVRLGHELWAKSVDALRGGREDEVADLLDHVAKGRLLRRHCERHGVALNHPSVEMLELAYHDITGNGLRPRLEAVGALRRLTRAADVERARTEAPATRASLRARAIAAAQRSRRDLAVDWTTLRLQDRSVQAITLADPWETANAEVEQLIDNLEGNGPATTAAMLVL
ncbi:MAG: proteasome accessory factor PafA2 family protein [Buchananella hordeovulneris]|nr:proteasome accessory factor PafA2 family protein [Buchananella hordeovulneris]